MLKRPEINEFPVTSATVLVVDDAAAMRLLVSKTLDRLGFYTLIAADGEAALTTVRDYHPDAIVTDLEMPGMDGEALITALKSSENPVVRDLPIIVCSSKNDTDTLAGLAAMGVDAVVPKPVDVRLLAKQALENFGIR